MELKVKGLLKLQEQDLEKRQTEALLKQLPEDIRHVEARISALKDEEKKRLSILQHMEVERKRVDSELKAEEEKIVKFKTQQMDVKKNEEYEALNVQIAGSQERVGVLEDEGLNLLMAIDEQRKKNAVENEQTKNSIQDLEKRIQSLNTQAKGLEEKLLELNNACEKIRLEVPAALLSKYDQVARQLKKGPFVVVLDGHRCSGCHLTVSNEVVSAVKKWTDVIPQCDNCSRILYLAD